MVLNDNIARLLKQSILELCRESVAISCHLEVDGIICLTVNGQEQHVVKIHEFFDKSNVPEVKMTLVRNMSNKSQSNESMRAATRVKCENVHESNKASSTRTYDSNENISDRVKMEVETISIKPDPDANENVYPKIQQEYDKKEKKYLNEPKSTLHISSSSRTFVGHTGLEKRCKTINTKSYNTVMNTLDRIKMGADINCIKPDPDADAKQIQQDDDKMEGICPKAPKSTPLSDSHRRKLEIRSGQQESFKTSNTITNSVEKNILDRIKMEAETNFIKPDQVTNATHIKQDNDQMQGICLKVQSVPKSTPLSDSRRHEFESYSGLQENSKTSNIIKDNAKNKSMDRIKIAAENTLIHPDLNFNQNRSSEMQQKNDSIKGTTIKESKQIKQIRQDSRIFADNSILKKRSRTSCISNGSFEKNKIESTSLKQPKLNSQINLDINTPVVVGNPGLLERCKTPNTSCNGMAYGISDRVIVEADNILMKPVPMTKSCTDSRQSNINDKKTHMSSAMNILCKICQKFFENVQLFQAHNLAAHNHSTCHVCLATFASRNSMMRHIRLMTCIKPYTCKTCPKRFSNQDDLRTHLRTHTLKRNFRCAQCKTRYSNKTGVKNHMKNEHNSEVCHVCPKCGESYIDIIKFQQHKKSHQQLLHSKEHLCEKCHKVLKSPYKLREHMLSHLPKSLDQDARQVDNYSIKGGQDSFAAKAKNERVSNILIQRMDIDEDNRNKTNLESLPDLMEDDAVIDKGRIIDCSNYVCIECSQGFRTENELENHKCSMQEKRDSAVNGRQENNKCADERSIKKKTNPYEESTQVELKHHYVYNEETVTESVTCGACRAIFPFSKGLEDHLKIYPDHKL